MRPVLFKVKNREHPKANFKPIYVRSIHGLNAAGFLFAISTLWTLRSGY